MNKGSLQIIITFPFLNFLNKNPTIKPRPPSKSKTSVSFGILFKINNLLKALKKRFNQLFPSLDPAFKSGINFAPTVLAHAA
ncbi:MAG: hypothetical protein QXS37_02700 [Candidatus Aenigmatarchaeota archaeon]